MKTNIRYVLLCALQDRLFYGLVALIIAIAAISHVLGGTAFIENPEITLVFTAGAVRLTLAITAIVFVCFYVKSAFDHKHMDVLLSRPISRDYIVLSHWLGFSVVSICMVIPVVLVFWLLGVLHVDGLIGWSLSMILELWIIVAFALFASLIMKSAVVSVLASLAFYVLARMIILFVMTAERGAAGADLAFLSDFLEWVALIIPRIDLFSKSEWLIYGLGESFALHHLLGQTLLYVSLLLIMCMMDFRKRQF